ncbi:MAG: AzlD domain-containing protein [Bacteroidaceae bacterium]|nr:AzlD domain-containing protein [Bacteroidaceae bacterium]
MINVPHSLLLVAIASLVTLALRLFPFILFGRNGQMPPAIKTIADRLPPAIIAVLVIYCLKGQFLTINKESLAAALAIVVIIPVHRFKRNTLLSIAAGTLVYMALLRMF